MAGKGRPKALLVLTGEERETLERWATPADERPGPGPALPHRAGLRRGADEPAGGGRRGREPGHGRQVARALLRAASRRPARRAPSRRAAHDLRRRRRAGDRQDPGGDAAGRDPLVDALAGGAGRHEPVGGEPHLARLRPEAPPARELQALHRPAVHREGPRHRRALPEPARGGGRALRR